MNQFNPNLIADLQKMIDLAERRVTEAVSKLEPRFRCLGSEPIYGPDPYQMNERQCWNDAEPDDYLCAKHRKEADRD